MRVLLLLLVLLVPGAARAQAVVVSDGPDHVAVTLYREPGRLAGTDIDRNDPGGYALISETRTITIPAGVAVIRFEGVAGGILPESALVAGLPGDVEEKNLDADLLSPRTLFDRALGRRVVIRRTDPATGKAIEQQAVIRSSAGGAAVLQVAGGYEGLRCSGLPETLVYDSLPDGLSAKPTLSVRTSSPIARRVTITLSYLAGGFDWGADYVVTMDRDGRGGELFAWITLASADPTSFVDSDLQVVAGKLNRKDGNGGVTPSGGPLALKCWPLPSYDFPEHRYEPPPVMVPLAAPPPPPAPAPMVMAERAQDIVVTGSKIARQEELGDLKLYRFPERVTVASNGQKQVAMLDKHGVKLSPVYVTRVDEDDVRDTMLILRTTNRTDNGLGVALPAGNVAVFGDVEGRRMLIGRSKLDDKAVDEKVELKLGETDLVEADTDSLDSGPHRDRYRLTVTNANAWPVDYEAEIAVGDDKRLERTSRRLGRKDGQALWAVRIPANGTATLDYTVRDKPARREP